MKPITTMIPERYPVHQAILFALARLGTKDCKECIEKLDKQIERDEKAVRLPGARDLLGETRVTAAIIMNKGAGDAVAPAGSAGGRGSRARPRRQGRQARRSRPSPPSGQGQEEAQVVRTVRARGDGAEDGAEDGIEPTSSGGIVALRGGDGPTGSWRGSVGRRDSRWVSLLGLAAVVAVLAVVFAFAVGLPHRSRSWPCRRAC